MKSVIEEYEAAMNQMIEDTRADKECTANILEQVNEEKQSAANELATMRQTLQELRTMNEQLQIEKQTLEKAYSRRRTLFTHV